MQGTYTTWSFVGLRGASWNVEDVGVGMLRCLMGNLANNRHPPVPVLPHTFLIEFKYPLTCKMLSHYDKDFVQAMLGPLKHRVLRVSFSSILATRLASTPHQRGRDCAR